jgi:alpha-beta hydrolase superfamily lysophospholipase
LTSWARKGCACRADWTSQQERCTLAARGTGVLRFDFTGLEQSSGDFSYATFSGDVADLVAAARTMEREGYTPRILIGHSLGGAAVLASCVRPDLAMTGMKRSRSVAVISRKLLPKAAR